MSVQGRRRKDALPCRTGFPAELIPRAKKIIAQLGTTSPELLEAHGIDPRDWTPVARAAVESMRGTASATTTEKRRFLEQILIFCQDRGIVKSWVPVGDRNRQDYKVVLSNDRQIAIESKGCGDGNNSTIWDRPSWADEFIVWSLCPDSLVKDPGEGAWSAMIRIANKVVAERKQVDAYIFWDGRCGSTWRRCPKRFGVDAGLRILATEVPGEDGRESWLPPPCIFMFPRSVPRVGTNPLPPCHTTKTCTFSDVLLEVTGVPADKRPLYVHDFTIEVQGAKSGTQIRTGVISRGRDDGDELVYTAKWRTLGREP